MSHRPQLDSEILSILPENVEGKTILDLGMGYGTWGFLIRTRKNGYPYIVGTDLFKDYINRHRDLGIYNEVYQKDILNTGFEDGSFDIVLACEIIEHLDKPDGYKLLDEAERLSKELVIFSTPHKVINPRRISKTPFMDPNPLNKHVSKWVPPQNLSAWEDYSLTQHILNKGYRWVVIPTKSHHTKSWKNIWKNIFWGIKGENKFFPSRKHNLIRIIKMMARMFREIISTKKHWRVKIYLVFGYIIRIFAYTKYFIWRL